MDWCTTMYVIQAISRKIQSRTIQWIWSGRPTRHSNSQPSQLLHAAVRMWRHLRERTVFYNERRLLGQASSAKTLQAYNLSVSANEIYKSEWTGLRLVYKLYRLSTLKMKFYKQTFLKINVGSVLCCLVKLRWDYPVNQNRQNLSDASSCNVY